MQEAVLLKSPFRYESKPLWWGRARLTRNHLILQGLGWTGRHRRRIPLQAIARVEWVAGLEDRRSANLFLILHEGETVAIRVRNAGLWKFTLDAYRPHRAGDTEKQATRPAA
ncbi:hypothetical protein GQ464_011985 [Rhodocaloribacter litoris]|uniref:hypothetical protein n=1 Tax=Rhodocaloribacter litoris TaxID=2558931 RepID=UPI00142449AE|nr:hypothetical protein [Rhodocaloribacter litoris]QXD14172.1 hypothetical protein GQ464_011985 [Rhodocaloribacter litoris]GIV59956.1 MAG: hypothetical protein KatS3mg043_1045 [Rhodothermaceae bacterium]